MILKGDKFYEFKIGLKGLELLGQNPSLNEEENLDFILLCGLLKYSITVSEIQKIKENLTSYQIADIKIEANKFSPVSPQELTELYARCGELGLSPSEFFFLTPDEIDWLYEGYLRRKELECNVILTAINQSKNRPDELVQFVEDKGYSIGNMEERKHTFFTLGIEEVE